MHKYLRFGYLENLDTVRRIPVGRLWGVTVSVTPITWLGPPLFFGLRALLTALGGRLSLPALVYDAFVFTLAVELATLVHALGHIAGGHLVRSPMDELLFTATRGVNLYHGDQSRYPPRVHLGRALGGPVANLLVAALSLALPLGPGLAHDLAASLVSINLVFGLGGLLPLPSVDGEVIWRELRRALAPHPPPST